MAQESNFTGTRLSLLGRARVRDASAWRELVDLYAPLVAHWCHRCGLNSHDTSDCIQEVFSAVAMGLESYQPHSANGAFRSWMWTITRNKVRDLMRKQKRQPRAEGGSSAWQAIANAPAEPALPDAEPTTAEQLDNLIHRALERVRSEFESRTWQAFWRTAIDGIPTAVVAQELGITSAAVRQYRARIMRRLREQLGDVR